MCFQRSSERIEGESRPPKPGWKVIPQSRTSSRETSIAEFVVSSWNEQLPHLHTYTLNTHGSGLCGSAADVFMIGWLCAFFTETRFGWTPNITRRKSVTTTACFITILYPPKHKCCLTVNKCTESHYNKGLLQISAWDYYENIRQFLTKSYNIHKLFNKYNTTERYKNKTRLKLWKKEKHVTLGC